MLVFKERGKPEYPEKNLSEQGREPTTHSTQATLLGGECSRHCATLVAQTNLLTVTLSLHLPFSLQLVQLSTSFHARNLILGSATTNKEDREQNLLCTVKPPCATTSRKRHLPRPTIYPKHQNVPSQSFTVGTSRKRPPPVSDRDHFLGLKV